MYSLISVKANETRAKRPKRDQNRLDKGGEKLNK